MSSSAPLDVVDYVVAILILLVPVFVGIWYAIMDANRSTREEYLLGGRQMSLLPVTLSLFITFQSGISQLGLPVEAYFYGGIYILAGFGLGLSYVVGSFTIVPLMYPLHITSVYKYLKLRYKSELVRVASTMIGMVTTICFMALALLSPALALGASANVPLWVSIALFGAVGTLYTAIGGFKSVVWTDVFQTIVICIGMSIIIIKGCVETGGVGNIFSLAQVGGRLDLNRFTADLTFRHSIWGVTVAHCFIWLVHGFSQSTLQRISSIKTLHGAKVAYLSLTLFVLVYGIVFCFFGLLIFAYFSMKECDPYEAGLISNRNQLAPFFVLHAMSDMSGMRGLYVAILCCGSISTLSSGLNALAANTVEDLLRWPLRKLREGTVIFITKLIVTAYGGLIIGLAYLTTRLGGSVIQMATTVFGAFGSPILGISLMGASFPWANKYGALVGAAVSLSFNLWIGFGRKVYGIPPNTLPSIRTAGCSEWAFFTNSTEPILETNLNNSDAFVFHNSTMNDTILVNLTRESDPDIFVLYRISYEWYSLLGTLVCVSVGLGISLFTKRFDRQNKNKDGARTRRSSEAQFIFPFLQKFWNMETSSCNNSNDVMYETVPRKSNKQRVKLLRHAKT